MKFNKLILVSALISTLSLPALAASNGDPNSLNTADNAIGQAPAGMPMMNMGQPQNMPMTQYRQNQMPTSSFGAGHHPGALNKQGGMGMPMMKMMPQKMAEMQQHRTRVETHLTNIENSLQQLVELQKAK